jgi:hypothetical protein
MGVFLWEKASIQVAIGRPRCLSLKRMFLYPTRVASLLGDRFIGKNPRYILPRSDGRRSGLDFDAVRMLV